MAVSVGIDLGTTFSAVAIVDSGSGMPRVVSNGEGAKITPSVIQFINGKPIFGSEAESAFTAGEPNCAATFKRNMGKDEVYCVIDGQPYTAEDLSSMLLKHLKEDAEMALGDTIKDAVITVPAYFYSPEREATIRAAEKAGLKVKKIIDEPNAAAMAYGVNNWRENANILVYDLGGGTFDVTLTHMERNGELRTIVTRGDHLLGGRDWDAQIEALLIEKFTADTDVEIDNNPEYKTMIRGLSEETKKKLTSLPIASVSATIDGVRSTVQISREEFEANTASLLERTGVLCRAVLDEAGLSIKDVTDVLLVGGSTRMPQVSQYLTRLFGKKPITHVNPDEAVALGAAIQSTKEDIAYVKLAIMEKDGKKVTDRGPKKMGLRTAVQPARKLNGIAALSLQETTAHAMGIVAINDEGNHYYNEIIIPANHPRPVRSAKRFRFYTSPTSKNELEIFVLQGDSENPLDCLIPYKFVVSGIQHVNRGETFGTVIRVQYSYDINGVIHVQARQEDDTVDLPIRKDVAPTDIAWLRQVPSNGNSGQRSTHGLQVGGAQNVVHKYRPINFSNVKWQKYDRISDHPDGSEFNEPLIHVVASEENIEFHGYNISAMDEGVTYTIDSQDDFEIECDINTSTISPHPGGFFKMSLGIISANLDQNGGSIYLDGDPVATVGSTFKLKMSLSRGGRYDVYVDRRLVGSKDKPTRGGIDVLFGFEHESHYCNQLSHAYVSDIMMMQRSGGDDDDESSEVATWDD